MFKKIIFSILILNCILAAVKDDPIFPLQTSLLKTVGDKTRIEKLRNKNTLVLEVKREVKQERNRWTIASGLFTSVFCYYIYSAITHPRESELSQAKAGFSLLAGIYCLIASGLRNEHVKRCDNHLKVISSKLHSELCKE